MSARAEPQEGSGERVVAMRRSWCWNKTGQWRMARRHFRCGSAAGLVESVVLHEGEWAALNTANLVMQSGADYTW